jgi:hypothetical protein
VKKYTTDYYLLDSYYRKSIEYHLALGTDIPVMNAIDDVKAMLDIDYARITNDINIEWVKCLQERGNGFGFKPTEGGVQRKQSSLRQALDPMTTISRPSH